MKTGFRRPSESNVQVYVDIGDPYPGRAEFIEYFEFANPAFQTPAIKTWGGNNYGQLALANTTNRSNPTQVGALTNWKQASAGALHGAAVKYDGTLWAWGHNGYGQIGDSTLTNRSSPVQIGTRTDWLQVSCGFTHTLAISQDGNLWAWGSNIYGQIAATGLPFVYSSIVATGSSNWTVPGVWNNNNNKIECIGAGGGGHAPGGGGGAYAAIENISLSPGTVYTANVGVGGTSGFTFNSAKSGGDTWLGGTSFLTSLVGAVGGGGATYFSASPGSWTPGVGGSASLSRGTIKYSGGSGGQAGASNNQQSFYYGGGGGGGAGGPFGTGAAGGGGRLGPDFPSTGGGGGGNGGGLNGNVPVFGSSIGGTGGNGRITSTTYGIRAAAGASGTQGGGGGGASTTPIFGPGGTGGAGIDINGAIGSGGGGGGGSASNTTGAEGVGGNGGLYGGGGGGGAKDYSGGNQGGTGANGAIVISYESKFASSPIQVGTSNTWVQVSAGGYHSLGIQRDYTTWAWGANGFSQCGVPGVNILIPTQLLDENADVLYSRSLAAGTQQSLAISPEGKLYAWGDGSYGQLGNGSTAVVANPQQVGALTTWKNISSRGVSSGGILDDGSLYTWGYNGNFNLGLGDVTNRSSPVKIGRNQWQEISMGLYHTVAVKYDGSLWTWGFNASGELGNNTAGLGQFVTTPAQITGLTNWKRAHAGGNPIDVLWPLNGNVDIAAQGFTVSIAVATDF